MRLRIELLLASFAAVSAVQAASVRERICEGGAPSFSRDGRRMAFQRAVDGRMRVGVLDLKTGATTWTEQAGDACHPFFAADGSLVYSYANITNTAHVRFVKKGPQDGYGIRRWKDGVATDITHGLWRDYQPSVSPDMRVYFCTQREVPDVPSPRIDSVPLEGGAPKPFLLPVGERYLNASLGQPVVSPDGRMVAWAQLNTFYDSWHVVAARMDDLGRECAVSPPGMVAYAPRWSPDGRMIAFTGYREGDPRWCVYLASLETGGVKRLCEGEDPDFTPDGRAVAYSDRGVVYRQALGPDDIPAAPSGACAWDEPGRVAFSTNGVPADLMNVELPKSCTWGRRTCFIRARFVWDGDAKCLQDVCRAGWHPVNSSLQLYIKDGYANFSVRDINWNQTYLPARKRLSGAGEHSLVGIRTQDAMYFSVDGGPVSTAYLLRNVASLDKPDKMMFQASGFRPQKKILSCEIGTGWPGDVPKPLTLVELGAAR